MKNSLALLFTTFSLAAQAVSFGGINFHSSVETAHSDLISKDLRYLYSTPVLRSETAFLRLLGVTKADGLTLHNWLVNRANFIVGEKFDSFTQENLLMADRPMVYPATPLPRQFADIPALAEMESALLEFAEEEEEKFETSMSNVGTALYIVGKKVNLPLAIKWDESTTVAIRSPRVGLFQVGPGFFKSNFGPVESDASAISRLETLFHESRHSDGTGESTGFLHIPCPEGHDYAGAPACDDSSNGPYTVGAYTERHLIANCTTCVTTQRIMHQAGIADNFSRVLDNGPMEIKAAQENLRFHEQLLVLYTARAAYLTTAEAMAEMANELAAIRTRIEEIRVRVDQLTAENTGPAILRDATAEGDIRNITVEQSSALLAVPTSPIDP